MTLVFSFCKVRHEWEDSLKKLLEIPGFQEIPPGRRSCAGDEQPSKPLMLNLKNNNKV